MKRTGLYKSMRGEVVDMAALAAQNERAIALGNAKLNARGDILGPGGKIIKTKEQITNEYYNNSPNAVPHETSIAQPDRDVFVDRKVTAKTAAKIEVPKAEELDLDHGERAIEGKKEDGGKNKNSRKSASDKE